MGPWGYSVHVCNPQHHANRGQGYKPSKHLQSAKKPTLLGARDLHLEFTFIRLQPTIGWFWAFRCKLDVRIHVMIAELEANKFGFGNQYKQGYLQERSVSPVTHIILGCGWVSLSPFTSVFCFPVKNLLHVSRFVEEIVTNQRWSTYSTLCLFRSTKNIERRVILAVISQSNNRRCLTLFKMDHSRPSRWSLFSNCPLSRRRPA